MDQRAACRFPTDLEAECRSSNRSWASRLRNVSVSGCLIVCPEGDLPSGALLRIRIKGLTAIDGEIVWQHRGHAGVKFRVPLHPAMIEHLVFRDGDQRGDPPSGTPLREDGVEPRAGVSGHEAQRAGRTPPREKSRPGQVTAA